MIVLRILRERGVAREVVCRQLPATLGRGPDNDVVLPDASVSRTHARIEALEEGGFRLVDLESRNGLHLGPQRVREIRLGGTVRCRVGRTEVELEEVSDAPTIEISAAEWQRLNRRHGLLHHVVSLALGVAGWATFTALQPQFWSPWNKQRWVAVLSSMLGAFIIVPVLAFGLLVVLKAVGRAVRVSDTLRVVALLTWLAPLSLLAEIPAYYVLSSSGRGALSELVGLLVIVIVVVAGASVRRPRPRFKFTLAWTLAVVATFVGFRVVSSFAERRSGAPSVDYRVLPPVAGWAGRSETVDDLLADIQRAADSARTSAEVVRQRQSRSGEGGR